MLFPDVRGWLCSLSLVALACKPFHYLSEFLVIFRKFVRIVLFVCIFAPQKISKFFFVIFVVCASLCYLQALPGVG